MRSAPVNHQLPARSPAMSPRGQIRRLNQRSLSCPPVILLAAVAPLLVSCGGGGGATAPSDQVEVNGTPLVAGASFGASQAPIVSQGASAPTATCQVVINGSVTATPTPTAALPTGLAVVAGQVAFDGVMQQAFQFSGAEVSNVSSASTGNRLTFTHAICPSAGYNDSSTAQITLTLTWGDQTFTVTTPSSQISIIS